MFPEQPIPQLCFCSIKCHAGRQSSHVSPFYYRVGSYSSKTRSCGKTCYTSCSFGNASVALEVYYPKVTITGFLSLNTTVFYFFYPLTPFLRKKQFLKSDMHDCNHLQCQSNSTTFRLSLQ